LLTKLINGFTTAWKGLSLTVKHLFANNSERKITTVSDSNYFKQLEKGTNTIQYPKQQLPVPEIGRYQLDVEMDDCIVCDLCAKVCPVDCIDIEAIKATEAIGQTSDGTTKRFMRLSLILIWPNACTAAVYHCVPNRVHCNDQPVR
jgi:NADH-quinone oxidoreductase subunit I